MAMISILEHFQWQFAAAATLLLGFVLGALFGRARIAWRLRAEIQEAKDKAEWERARREDLARQLEAARNSGDTAQRDCARDDVAAVALLRRELDRLRHELRQTLEGQGEAQRRIQELEARITVLASSPSKRVGSAAVGESLQTEGGLHPRQKSPGDNILTLWNSQERDSAGEMGEGDPVR